MESAKKTLFILMLRHGSLDKVGIFGESWSDSGYILKMEFTGYADASE